MKYLKHSLWLFPLLAFVFSTACQPPKGREADELFILPRQDGGTQPSPTADQAPTDSHNTDRVPTEPHHIDRLSTPDTPQTTPDLTTPEPKAKDQVNQEPSVPDLLPPEPQLQPSVSILEPSNDSAVTNPVTFKITAKDVHRVALFSGATSLGPMWDPKIQKTLSYKFTNVNREHTIHLKGYNISNQEVAQHSIKIQVKEAPNQNKGTFIAKMYITYYYLALESDHTGSATTPLYDKNCKTIAKVPEKFASALCIEGSGRLKDGRVVNYEKTCRCGSSRCHICYSVLDKTKFPWGVGSKSNPLKPLRSLAVDRRIIPIGTKLYIPEWDGIKMPAIDGVGGFTHDGCFQADDVGGGIKGNHFDFFSGTKTMWKALGKIHPTRKYLTVYKNPGRCP